MKNQKVDTKLGVAIIVIFAITVGVLVWKVEKNQSVVNQLQGTVQVKKPTIQSPAENLQNQTAAGPVDKKNPFDNLSISSFNKWKTYTDKNIGIEVKYPPELYLSSSQGKIIFDYFSPTDPAQNDEGSVLTHLNISLQQGATDQYIKKYKLITLQNYKRVQINLNGTLADKITYTDAFAGGIIYTILIQKGSELIIIDYAGDNKLEDTFNKMLSTVKGI